MESTRRRPQPAPVDQALLTSFQSRTRIYLSILEKLELDANPVEVPPLAIAHIDEWQGPVLTSSLVPETIRAAH